MTNLSLSKNPTVAEAAAATRDAYRAATRTHDGWGLLMQRKIGFAESSRRHSFSDDAEHAFQEASDARAGALGLADAAVRLARGAETDEAGRMTVGALIELAAPCGAAARAYAAGVEGCRRILAMPPLGRRESVQGAVGEGGRARRGGGARVRRALHGAGRGRRAPGARGGNGGLPRGGGLA